MHGIIKPLKLYHILTIILGILGLGYGCASNFHTAQKLRTQPDLQEELTGKRVQVTKYDDRVIKGIFYQMTADSLFLYTDADNLNELKVPNDEIRFITLEQKLDAPLVAAGMSIVVLLLLSAKAAGSIPYN
jgi:hypothetical protein